MKVKYAWCDEIEEINDAIDSKGKADGFEAFHLRIRSSAYHGTRSKGCIL